MLNDDDGIGGDQTHKNDDEQQLQPVTAESAEQSFADDRDEIDAAAADEEDDSAAREQAASKIQAIQRGRAVRKNMNAKSFGDTNDDALNEDGAEPALADDRDEIDAAAADEEDDSVAREQAASKIQAIQRGRAVRKNMNTTSTDDTQNSSLKECGEMAGDKEGKSSSRAALASAGKIASKASRPCEDRKTVLAGENERLKWGKTSSQAGWVRLWFDVEWIGNNHGKRIIFLNKKIIFQKFSVEFHVC